MSPERAAETARIEIVALFMPTCLSSAALVPRAQLFYILLPGASPLRGSASGLLSCRPLSRAQSTVRLRLTEDINIFSTACGRVKSGLKPAVKNRAAHGGEECAARMVKTKADALGIGGQTPICRGPTGRRKKNINPPKRHISKAFATPHA